MPQWNSHGRGPSCHASMFSWYCSIASCIGLYDPDFDFARQYLDLDSTYAYDLAMESLGGPSYLERSKVELLPVGESDALKGEFYQEWARTNKKHKIQRLFQTISDDNHRASLIRLRGKLCDINHKIVVKSLQNSPEGSCLLSRLFTTPLSFRDSRLNKTQFILACRPFLGLPPPKNEDLVIHRRTCGCEYQICGNPSCGGCELDSYGNHGLTCHPGIKAQRATLMEKALEKGFRRAGGVPTRQPHTYDLLGGYFTKEDISRLFPGGMDYPRSQRSKQLCMTFLDILRDHRSTQRAAHLGQLRDFEFPPARSSQDERADVIRYDLRLPTYDPIDCPRSSGLTTRSCKRLRPHMPKTC